MGFWVDSPSSLFRSISLYLSTSRVCGFFFFLCLPWVLFPSRAHFLEQLECQIFVIFGHVPPSPMDRCFSMVKSQPCSWALNRPAGPSGSPRIPGGPESHPWSARHAPGRRAQEPGRCPDRSIHRWKGNPPFYRNEYGNGSKLGYQMTHRNGHI